MNKKERKKEEEGRGSGEIILFILDAVHRKGSFIIVIYFLI